MANLNNAVGTNGAFGGRTSVNAFNDVLSAFSGRGIVSGWVCSPKSGLTVNLGGDGVNRDVAIAEDASGNKTTINNILQSPVAVTVNGAPASNSRVDAIVAYIEDSPQGSGETDNPDVVNLLVVSGTVASTPVRPTDSAIRTAITTDGASGSTAYYVVLAYVTIPTGTTDIDATMVSSGDATNLKSGMVTTDSISDGAVTASKIDYTSATATTASLQIAQSGSVTLHRVGNLVWVGQSAVISSMSSGVTVTTGYTCPVGFRPASGTSGEIIGNCVDGQFTSSEVIGVDIQDDGTVVRSSRVNITGATRVEMTGCWATSDAWPS